MILKLEPAVKSYLWGGHRLKDLYHKKCEGDILAETWELSCHPDGPSIIAAGPDKGKTLEEVIEKNRTAMLGRHAEGKKDFPVLVKLIDAKKPLSIQVHPTDAYALEHEGQYGKTEMWYVVDCEPDAFLYYGFQKDISAEEFEERIEKGTLTEVLNKVYVHPGDSFFIEAGTVHAIGAGILIAEIQQNSNVTYRVYDYQRRDAHGNLRPLHIQKAKEVVKLQPPKTTYDFDGHLAKCEYFTVDRKKISEMETITFDGSSYTGILMLYGGISVETEREKTALMAGECAFISADTKDAVLSGDGEFLWITV